MTLDILIQANQNELALFTTKIVDRIKLRSAIDVHRSKNVSKNVVSLFKYSLFIFSKYIHC